MYGQFYGFREKPFSLLPDPDFLFPSRKHQMALNLLEMAIFNQSGFCVISGEIGTGKTTLVRELLNRLDDTVCVGLISNTHDSFAELLGWVLSAFDIAPESGEAICQHRQFTEFLTTQYAAGRHTLLIIDEAQNLSLSAMEQLRMLSNVNSNKDLILQVILVGQRELRGKLQTPGLAQFAQRISIDYHLTALDETETVAYIRHRLEHAGGAGDLFDEAACKRVYAFSKGVPRVINRLCDLGLVYGFADQARSIGSGLIDAVARDQKLLSTGKLPVRQTLPGNGLHNNKNGIEQSGAKIMNEPRDQQPDRKTTASKTTASKTDAPQPRANAAVTEPPHDATPTAAAIEALQTAAEKALEEKTQAEKVAAEKAAQARAAIEKAAAELSAARAAASEKLAAEKLAAEKIIADRKAAKQLARSRASAESAASQRQAAQQAVLEMDAAASQAVAKVGEEKNATDNLVFDRISCEKTALEEARVATAAAEQALAERIAAEKAAAEIAAAADAAVKQALRERVAAEKLAAERVSAAEIEAGQARERQAQTRRIAEQKLAAEQAAISQAKADAAAASAAAAARKAAREAEQLKIAAAERVAEQANALRAAAEQAVSGHMAANRVAAEKLTAEKVALAKVASSVAAAAKQAAERAEAAKSAALKEASETESAAIDAAQKAAEAERAAQQALHGGDESSAEVVALPQAVDPRKQPHPLDNMLLAGTLAKQAQDGKPAGRRAGKTWAVMTIAAVAAGASLLAGKWVDFKSDDEARVVKREPPADTASMAAMEVSREASDPKRQP